MILAVFTLPMVDAVVFYLLLLPLPFLPLVNNLTRRLLG